jgi:hypothetical protein
MVDFALAEIIENEISQWLIITATIPIFDTFTKRLEIAFQQVRLLNIFICAEKPEELLVNIKVEQALIVQFSQSYHFNFCDDCFSLGLFCFFAVGDVGK